MSLNSVEPMIVFRKSLTVVLLLGFALNLGYSDGFVSSWEAGVLTARAQEDQPEQESDSTESEPEVPEIPGDTTILTIASVGLVLIVIIGVMWHMRAQKPADLGKERSAE